MTCREPNPAGLTKTRSWLHPAAAIFSLLGLLLPLAPAAGAAQPSPDPAARAAAESLTQAILGMQGPAAAADPTLRALGMTDPVSIAAAREQHLAALIHTDPAGVLRLAIPAHLRAALPPAVQAHVEEEVDLDGHLEVLHEDWTQGSRYLHFLEAAGRRYSLHFAADEPKLETGTYVRAKGVRVQQAMALSSGSADVQALAAPPPNTFGEQRVLVILVNFPDKNTQPYTPVFAQNLVLGTTGNFYYENSYQQNWFTGDVAGWLTIAELSTACNYTSIASQARSAASAAGYVLSSYNRHVFAFPQNACGWWGRGSVGANPSQAWINGSLQLRVVGHELGHNVGLYHSHALALAALSQ